MTGSYEFVNKNTHRATILELYRERSKPIVFLDDESAGASLYFLKNGVPKRDLKPVNFDKKCATSIIDASGLSCICDDVDNCLTELSTDSCSVVWLDYMKRTVTVDALRESLRVASYVSVTISLRGIDRVAHLVELRRIVKMAGGAMLQYNVYKGRSGVENMMTFLVSRRASDANDASEHAATPDPKHAEDAQFNAGDRVVVEWTRNVSLTAVVVDASDDARVHVAFDCDGVLKWVPRHRVVRNETVLDDATLNSIVGRSIALPRSLWPKKVSGYDDVMPMGEKKLMFRVMKRFRNGERYTIAGISKRTGRPLSKHEAWTLTYDQACCFLPRGTA